jgi:hypothetical protein
MPSNDDLLKIYSDITPHPVFVPALRAVYEAGVKDAVGGDAVRYTSDGALAECPCCGSLDVGGAHDTVHCYKCGLSMKHPPPLQNAADAWNRRPDRLSRTAAPDVLNEAAFDRGQNNPGLEDALRQSQIHLNGTDIAAVFGWLGDDQEPGVFADGLLWIGELDDGGNGKRYGIHVANGECPEEGSVTLAHLRRQEATQQPAAMAEMTDAELVAAVRPLCSSEQLAEKLVFLNRDEYLAVITAFITKQGVVL